MWCKNKIFVIPAKQISKVKLKAFKADKGRRNGFLLTTITFLDKLGCILSTRFAKC